MRYVSDLARELLLRKYLCTCLLGPRPRSLRSTSDFLSQREWPSRSRKAAGVEVFLELAKRSKAIWINPNGDGGRIGVTAGQFNVEFTAIGQDLLERLTVRCLKWLDGHAVVSDADTFEAQRRLWDASRIVVEPSAATALAALTSGAYVPEKDERVAVLLCGANAEPDWFMNEA